MIETGNNKQDACSNPFGQGCLVIAEVAQSHEGSLGMAHAFIDAVAASGAGAVKFQTHIAEAESTLDEPWRVKFSEQDGTRFDYWKRMGFSKEQWAGLAEHAGRKGILFLSSPFSVDAVALLEEIGVPFWKIASGEVSNPEMLEAVWETQKPVLFSTGLATGEELDKAVEGTRKRCIPFGILQCTSEYPAPPEKWGLRMISEFREKYGCPVGLSDHSGSIAAGIAAAALGADIIEVHVTFSRRMFGPDVKASLEIEELSQLVRAVSQVRQALDSPVSGRGLSELRSDYRRIFGRSLALKQDLPGGTVLKKEHLTLKKPGTGIPHEEAASVVGRRLVRDKKADRLLSRDDFE
jgi:N-acetylneuraminate synthase